MSRPAERLPCGPESDWPVHLANWLGNIDNRFSALRARRVLQALQDGPASREELARALAGGQNMSERTPYLTVIDQMLAAGLLCERPAFSPRTSRFETCQPQRWLHIQREPMP